MESTRPTIDLHTTESMIKQSVDALLKERNWLIDHYSNKINELVRDRDDELKKNAENLSKFGYNTENLPPTQFIRTGFASYRKLEFPQIKELLSKFMQQGEEYTSPVLIDYLGIVYREFRKFVQENPDFIQAKGKIVAGSICAHDFSLTS